MMEDESGFLSREHEREDAKMERIQKLLGKIFSDLNDKKVTTIVGKWMPQSADALAHY